MSEHQPEYLVRLTNPGGADERVYYQDDFEKALADYRAYCNYDELVATFNGDEPRSADEFFSVGLEVIRDICGTDYEKQPVVVATTIVGWGDKF